MLPGHIAVEYSFEFVEHYAFLPFVHFVDGADYLHGAAVFLACADKCADVLGEAGAAVAAARIQEFAAYARVGTDGGAHAVDVGAHALAEVGNLVDERDAGGEHGVCGIFGHFGRRQVHKHHSEVVQQERAVEPFHKLAAIVAFDAYHHPVGRHKVLYGGAFFQKLWVGCKLEGYVGASTALKLGVDRLPYFGRCADGHGRFCDQQRFPLYGRAKLTGHG